MANNATPTSAITYYKSKMTLSLQRMEAEALFAIYYVIAGIHHTCSSYFLEGKWPNLLYGRNSINRALKTHDFISSINANIKFEIYLKPASAVDFDLIKNKVEQVELSVSGLLLRCLKNLHDFKKPATLLIKKALPL